LQDPPKFTQNWDFWFENKPSGNPDWAKERENEVFSRLFKNKIFSDMMYVCNNATWQQSKNTKINELEKCLPRLISRKQGPMILIFRKIFSQKNGKK
jgi:hypothetical protein